jgi:hypothetical protein
MPTMSDPPVAAAIRALSAASNLAEARRAIDAWAPRFHEALDAPLVAGPWPKLGLSLTRIPGNGGFTARRGDSFFVGVGSEGGRVARFTLAHELGHIVLNSCEHRALDIAAKDEEDLCDLFARRALVPPALIRRHLAREGTPSRLADVERFAARFRITLRASLVALDEFFPPQWPVAFVAASWRPHPRRREVVGLRVDASASDRRLFVPTDCRLSTLGYGELEAWALRAAVGARAEGADDAVRMRSGEAGVSGWWGRSQWVAQRHYAPGTRADEDARGALCQLDVGALAAATPKRRRMGAGQRGSVAKIPGQLHLSARGRSAVATPGEAQAAGSSPSSASIGGK